MQDEHRTAFLLQTVASELRDVTRLFRMDPALWEETHQPHFIWHAWEEDGRFHCRFTLGQEEHHRECPIPVCEDARIALLEQKRGIESLYGEARNAAAPVRFSVSCQRYPFAVDAFLRLLRISGENRFRFGLRETGMDGVIDDVYDHRADVGVICLTDLTEKIICRLLDARELEFHELAAVCPCIYVRRGHPLADRSSVTEEELDGYPYVAFEHDQGVASDFFEEYPMVSLKKPAKCISVNNRATAMYVLASTDAFTSGSGLLSEGLADGSVVTIPLLGKTSVHLGWIHIRSSRPSPLTEQFVRLLEEALADSIAFTRRLQEGTAEET